MSDNPDMIIRGRESWHHEPPMYRPLISGEGASDYYRLGYYHAALDLASQLAEGKGHLMSAMPALFVFRQYLELAAKNVLNAASAFNIEQSHRDFWHKLDALVEELNSVLRDYDKMASDYFLKRIAPTMLEIHTADRKADAFRYPTRRDGLPHFEDEGVVCIGVLMNRMTEASAFFERLIRDMRREERDMDEAIREAVARDRT